MYGLRSIKYTLCCSVPVKIPRCCVIVSPTDNNIGHTFRKLNPFFKKNLIIFLDFRITGLKYFVGLRECAAQSNPCYHFFQNHSLSEITISAVSSSDVPESMEHFCRYLCASGSVMWLRSIRMSFALSMTFLSSSLL